MPLSAELETLDQLLGGPLPVSVIRRHYSDDAHFERGILSLLDANAIEIVDSNDTPLPRWRWRAIVADDPPGEQLDQYTLRLTAAGAKRIAGDA